MNKNERILIAQELRAIHPKYIQGLVIKVKILDLIHQLKFKNIKLIVTMKITSNNMHNSFLIQLELQQNS